MCVLSAPACMNFKVYAARLECVLASQQRVTDQDVTRQLQTAIKSLQKDVAGTDACSNGPESNVAWLNKMARCP